MLFLTSDFGIKVNLTANTSGVMIRNWAYESNGSPIIVGAIPESSTGIITALAGAFILFRRKRLVNS